MVSFRRDSCTRYVIISLIELIKVAGSGKEFLAITLFIELIVDSHHVLQVVSLVVMFWTLENPYISPLVVRSTASTLESLDVFWVASTVDFIFETLCSRARVTLGVNVLRLDARDESCVTWDALVPNLMLWTIDPGNRILALHTKTGMSLRLFILAIDCR